MVVEDEWVSTGHWGRPDLLSFERWRALTSDQGHLPVAEAHSVQTPCESRDVLDGVVQVAVVALALSRSMHAGDLA